MNKTLIAVAGGTSVVSLAAGAAGGYFYAKKKFAAKVDDLVSELVAHQVGVTKKNFDILLEEARKANAKPQEPADLSRVIDEEDVLPLEGEEEELSDKDRKTIAQRRETRIQATEALTNYQGYAKNDESGDEAVESNIFSSNATPKKQLPPRGPGGKFVPKSEVNRRTELEPQIITEHDFLLNDGELEQKSLLYFKGSDTLIDVENNNEPVDNGVIGEVNLTLFPEPDSLGESTIYVRNEGLGADYQVKLMAEDLTEFLGLGENEGPEEDEESIGDYADDPHNYV